MLSPAICDPCRYVPATHQAACVSTAAPAVNSVGTTLCDEQRCSWLVDSELTIGVQWGGGRGATRGWGNSFSYLRNLHEMAALLGRRLLVHPQRAYLPTAHVQFGRRRTWALPDINEYIYRQGALVVSDDLARAAAVPERGKRGFDGLEHTSNRTEYKWRLLRYLDTLHAEPHVWLNLSKAAMYVLTKHSTCPHVRHAPAFTDCLGRLMTMPVGPLGDKYAALRARVAGIGVDVKSSSSSSSSSGSSSSGSSGSSSRRSF